MKKLLIIILFIPFITKAQDSVRVNISPQVRDLEYITFFIFNDNTMEDTYDSLKVRFRVANPPTGNTTVSVTAYTMDWLNIMGRLKRDPVAIINNCTSRVETLLRAVGLSFINTRLDVMNVADTDAFQAVRQFGRSKLRRQ